MQSKLYIRLTSDSAPALRTLLVAEDGTYAASQETALSELAALASGCRVIVIVPATELSLMSAAVPSRNRQRILSAVPYILEDQLASDVEQLHFVIGSPDAAGQVATVVVEHQKMVQWLELLRTNGVEPHMIVADLCCLPVSETPQWTLLLEGNTALLSTGHNRGFALDRDNLMLMLRSALQACEQAADAPEQLRLMSSAGSADDLALVEALSEFDLIISREDEAVDALALFAQGLDEKQTLNLLQGQYSRRDQMGKLLRPWRAAAAMLVALILFSGGMTVADYFELRGEQAALKKHIEQTYLASCPGAKRIVNAKAQMTQCLKKLRGGGGSSDDGLLVMLSSVGDALKAAGGLQLQRISYRNGQLDMALAIADIQVLDQLKQRMIKDAGLQVEILSATSRDNRVEARLQLKGKGA
ncbi:MAG: type II secretion system protein GspL [Gammaproteobacteria bacterium]|nr:type II secretion system protein GspL [Gammaproteobacteria bacterium]